MSELSMSQPADILVRNVNIITMNDQQARVEEVAIRGNRILRVGRRDEAAGWTARRVIDGQGLTLIPGLIDSHFHLWAGSMQMADLQLDGMQDRLALPEGGTYFVEQGIVPG
jgi:predicted amidohydrolase YtcJ